ncbi:MAG: ACT domain-containing protein [Spirochaetales bacterium]|nr:ACT domain-containing protein [Spirochaetales bacterium]MCF7938036.1 ACT domain-containing protein [Spirochaetales bacterium]
MKITQISVFLENRKGRLHQVCDLLGKAGINILALTIAETEDFGVLRIIVDKPEEALAVFAAEDLVARQSDVVVVQIEDHPGGLADVLAVLQQSDVNIEYMHAFLGRRSEQAYMVFRFEQPDEAISVLKKAGIRVIENDEVVQL